MQELADKGIEAVVITVFHMFPRLNRDKYPNHASRRENYNVCNETQKHSMRLNPGKTMRKNRLMNLKT